MAAHWYNLLRSHNHLPSAFHPPPLPTPAATAMAQQVLLLRAERLLIPTSGATAPPYKTSATWAAELTALPSPMPMAAPPTQV